MNQQVIELFDELVENNYKLLKLLEGMPPEDRKEYAPRVQKMIADTWALIPTTKIVSEAPTLLLQQLNREEGKGWPDIKQP